MIINVSATYNNGNLSVSLGMSNPDPQADTPWVHATRQFPGVSLDDAVQEGIGPCDDGDPATDWVGDLMNEGFDSHNSVHRAVCYAIWAAINPTT